MASAELRGVTAEQMRAAIRDVNAAIEEAYAATLEPVSVYVTNRSWFNAWCAEIEVDPTTIPPDEWGGWMLPECFQGTVPP